MNIYSKPLGIPMDQLVVRLHDTGGRWGGLFTCIPLRVVPVSFSSFLLNWGIKRLCSTHGSNNIRISLKTF